MFAVLIYIAAIVTANLSIATFGPWVSPINAFCLIGLDLALRDQLHDRWQGDNLWLRMLCLISTAGAISYLLNPATGTIAIASTAAFALSGIADSAVYQAMRTRSFLIRSNGSNAAGAAVDSIIFPTLAFGGLMPEIVALQFAAKAIGGAAWAALLVHIKSEPAA